MFNSLLRFLQLSDPTLPIGSYAHSSGLETYVQQGLVNDAATARQFVTAMLERNLKYSDAAFLSLAYQSASAENIQRLLYLNEQCSAVKLPRETREASQKLGTRLMKIFQPVCATEVSNHFITALKTAEAAPNYAIVFAVFAVAMGISRQEALTGFCYNAAVGMITNAVKLIPLGQQQGQEILYSLSDVITGVIDYAMEPDEEMLGACCPAFDIRAMQHEQLYSRLYMS